ncbi:MAG: glycosyltransferase family 2 protein [Deltaproteobacteria bacterium]|nr:glycosyltransferase family 2 protein [Deltaproteobacteria bacterium]
MKLSLVILTYNEIVGVRALFDKIPQGSVDEVFVVDGGSTDGTVEFFKEKGVTVFGQDVRGRGEAFRVAFRKASGDALLFFSPDGNEDPADIPKFKPLLEKGYDMVIGTRMTPDAHNEEDELLLKPRKWANNAFNLMANLTWNRQKFVTDTINGFRAITKKAWHDLALDGPGYTIEYQSSIRAFKLGLKVAEFPTYESGRIDNREGAPSIDTGLAFVKLYLSELKVGKSWSRSRGDAVSR